MSSGWRKTVLAAERPAGHLVSFLFALVFLAAAAVGLFFVVQARGDFTGKLLLGVAVLGGLAWSGFETRKIALLLWEGTARLVLQAAPPAIGGRLEALLRLTGKAARASHVIAELACVRDREGGKVAPNDYAAGTVWTARHEFPVRREGSAGIAALAFEIPATCLPTGKWDSGSDDDRAGEHEISWQVRVSAVVGRELVEDEFHLEVFLPRPPATPVDWARDFAALALILANLVPIWMVLAGRADLAALAFLYWTENLVVASYMLLRVLYAGRGGVADKVGGVLFFVAWFAFVSIFLGRVMLQILLDLPRDWDQLTAAQFARGDSAFVNFGARVLKTIGAHLVEAGLLLAVAALIVSHGIGFLQNYIRNGQYRLTRVNGEMERLMNRGAVTFGAVFVLMGLAPLGSPAYVLAALVLLKAAYEVWRYARDKRLAQPQL